MTERNGSSPLESYLNGPDGVRTNLKMFEDGIRESLANGWKPTRKKPKTASGTDLSTNTDS